MNPLKNWVSLFYNISGSFSNSKSRVSFTFHFASVVCYFL